LLLGNASAVSSDLLQRDVTSNSLRWHGSAVENQALNKSQPLNRLKMLITSTANEVKLNGPRMGGFEIGPKSKGSAGVWF
jgi:hypothetical protein